MSATEQTETGKPNELKRVMGPGLLLLFKKCLRLRPSPQQPPRFHKVRADAIHGKKLQGELAFAVFARAGARFAQKEHAGVSHGFSFQN